MNGRPDSERLRDLAHAIEATRCALSALRGVASAEQLARLSGALVQLRAVDRELTTTPPPAWWGKFCERQRG